MPFEIGTGGGGHATVTEPQRAHFSANVRGAIEYALAHVLYKGLEIMGGALGAYVAGFGVQLLDRIEPSLVTYARPLIDMLLSAPGLPYQITNFLTQLRNPVDAGGAGMLLGLGGQAGGAIASSVIGAMLQPVTNLVNAAIRPSVPPVGDLVGMERRGLLSHDRAKTFLNMNGYFDDVLGAYNEYMRPRAGIDDLYGAVLRGGMTQAAASAELQRQGYTNADLNVFVTNLQRLLTVNEVMVAKFRHVITQPEATAALLKLGYTQDSINKLYSIAESRPGASDLVRFALREVFDNSIAAKYGYDDSYPATFEYLMGELGYNPTWSRDYWRAHWELPSPSMGYEMLHRGVIDPGTMDELLRVLDYPTYWRNKLTQISYNPLTRVDVRRMFKIGVVTRAQVKRTYQDLGYDAVNAELLTRFTEITYPPDPDDPTAAARDLTAGVITASYKKDLINRAQAIERLMAIGYDLAEATFYVNLADAQREVAAAPDYNAEHTRDLIAITERSFLAGNIDAPTANTAFQGIGLSSAEAGLRMNVLRVIQTEQVQEAQVKLIGDSYTTRILSHTDVIARLGALGIPSGAQNKLLAGWESERALRNRRLSESQYREALDLKQITETEYTEALRGLGYSERDATILTEQAMWYIQYTKS